MHTPKTDISTSWICLVGFRSSRLFAAIVITLMVNHYAEAKECVDWQHSNKINKEQLWADLTVLAADNMRGRKVGDNQLSRDYLNARYAQIGLTSFTSSYNHPFVFTRSGTEINATNVIGWVASRTQQQDYIVLSAHYDHLGVRGRHIYNGADDNASGVAAMLAIATALKIAPLIMGVIFVATDAEEAGLHGAKAFIESPPVPLTKIRLNINLDMIANAGRRKRLYLAHPKRVDNLNAIVDQAISTASVCLVAGHNGIRSNYNNMSKIDWRNSSDHAVFKRAGIDYLFFSVNDHRYYHTENDTIDTIDPHFYQAAVESVLATILIADDTL